MAKKMPKTLPRKPRLAFPTDDALAMLFLNPGLFVEVASRSARAARTASKHEVKTTTENRAPPMAKK
jgi:hypothetical protein